MAFFKKKEKPHHESVEEQRKSVFEMESPALAEIALGGLDCDQLPNCKGSFGHSHRNPIIVNGTYGALIYLGKILYGEKKQNILFHKLGEIPNLLTGVGKLNIYEILDESGTHWDILFVDMFHPRKSNICPLGYSFPEFTDEESKDRNKSLGVNAFCEKFPLDLTSKLISQNNPRYIAVEKTIALLLKNNITLERPVDHKIKVETIFNMLKELENE